MNHWSLSNALASIAALLLLATAPSGAAGAPVAAQPQANAQAVPAKSPQQSAAKPPQQAPAAQPNQTPAPKPPAGPKPTAGLLDKMLAGPLAGVEDIVFACRTLGKDGHWYANFGYYCPWPDKYVYGDRGRLCRFNLRTKKLTVLIDDVAGGVRDPQLSYDGRKILFSYRKGGQHYYQLYEIGVDGRNLRQLTHDPYDDIEPTYLPGGGIMFVSSRCNRWVNCWLTQVGVLYRCDEDGGNIRMVSSNNEHDNTPWPMSDGRILYTRWEYVDRSQMVFHHLWVVNSDGTNQMVYFGNQAPGYVMIDAKPIPGGNKVVSIFSPKHGRNEHTGEVRIIDPDMGPDEPDFARHLTRADLFQYRDPYPVSDDCFLIAQGPRIVVVDGQGAWETVYELPKEDIALKAECHEPRPLVARPREPVIPPRIDLAQSTGRLILADVRYGRNMDGVAPNEIKQLLVLETLPMPVHFQGGMTPISSGGTFTLERILGTIPVEEDGSAYAELPALRSLFFVALDDHGLSVKRMQSFVTVQPGETTSCAGCHEGRNITPPAMPQPALLALRRAPSPIEPIAGVPDVFDFPRDIQPILDKHCLQCHDWEQRSGGVCLSGDRGPKFSFSYFNLMGRKQIADGRNQERGNRAPRTIGSSASPLMKKIDEHHHGVTLSPMERDWVRLWIESGAVYPGTYAALATGTIGDNIRSDLVRQDENLPAVAAVRQLIQQRCVACHSDTRRLPIMPSDLGAKGRFSSYNVYNLTRPEKSPMLLAPLAREAGGLGLCKPLAPAVPKATTATAVAAPPKVPPFPSAADPAYQKLLAALREYKALLDDFKRFDMPGFRPREDYIREMKRYGILPPELGPGDPIDVYATDRAYWESFWYHPVGAPEPSATVAAH